MTPEQMRIKIAEACGWTDCKIIGNTRQFGIPPCNVNAGDNYRLLPDYLNDLNACHEMEKMLNEDQREIYAQILTGMSLCDRDGRMDWGGVFDEVAHVTATQRCEAFLTTLKLLES